jgi:hypothetical protein
MRHPLVLTTLIAALLGSYALTVRFIYKLSPYRVDLRPGEEPIFLAWAFGSSWPVRAFSRANYTVEGQRLLPRLWLLLSGQVLILVLFAAAIWAGAI